MVHIIKGNGVKVTRYTLWEQLRNMGKLQPTTTKSRIFLLNYVKDVIGKENITQFDSDRIEKEIKSFTVSLARKWKQCRCYVQNFVQNNEKWLQEFVITTGKTNADPGCSGLRGRPKISFEEAGQQTRRKIINDWVQDKSKEEVFMAAQFKLFQSGKRKTAKVIHNLRFSPERAARTVRTPKYSPDEALALFIQLKLTRNQYTGLRNAAKSKNLKNLYPSYHKLLEAKKKCYPTCISATEKMAEVKLQALLNHTSERLATVQEEVLATLEQSEENTEIAVNVLYKWGSEGSGSQCNYKQAFQEEGLDDSNIFITSIVPIRMYVDSDSGSKILWQNPRTSSTLFCRPIRIRFAKETHDLIKSEFAYIENEISELVPTSLRIAGKMFSFNHGLVRTMVDGKICNSLSSNKSTQKCYIRKVGPKDVNNLEFVRSLPCDTAALHLGLSSLHAYIRTFECLLHISYRLDFKEWQVRGEINKQLFNAKKTKVISRFRSEMGLLVDIPKPGYGVSNDGNTARRFFRNPKLAAQITGIDINLISQFNVMLTVLSCNYDIDVNAFKQYADTTANMYVQLYRWYPMPPTVHKILTHSKDVMESFLLPIGQLSEEAQESRHKDVKYYREHNTRKVSRTATNEDLFNILMVSSDPLISSMRILPERKSGPLCPDVISLLKPPEYLSFSDEEINSE